MANRVAVVLACAVCGARNYRTTRALQSGAPVLELQKYCPKCKKHTLHRESK